MKFLLVKVDIHGAGVTVCRNEYCADGFGYCWGEPSLSTVSFMVGKARWRRAQILKPAWSG
ncbi:MAG: hypothetical protein NTY53_05005 [Kiritimatiellaeota bacterium]|nr:hypothetical protein [Kiritimatiellota bacterium]